MTKLYHIVYIKREQAKPVWRAQPDAGLSYKRKSERWTEGAESMTLRSKATMSPNSERTAILCDP